METPSPSPITPSHTRIGWIGIGVMGFAMASRLMAAGYSLTIYARTPSKADPLRALGAKLVESPAAVATSSDVVFTMLGHPEDVRQIILDKDTGVLSGFRSSGVMVDHTSSHPDLARQIYDAAREKNCWSVDAPVSGGDVGAKNGNLSIFAGGNEDLVRWLTPLFQILGRQVTYMGGPGSGQSCKIGNQIVVGANLLGLSEGLVFADQAGLDRNLWLDAVRGGSARSMVMELFGQRMIDGEFEPGGFAEYMVKDMGLGVNFIDKEDEEVVVLPGAAVTKQLFVGMVANGDGKMGTQGLISVINRLNGRGGRGAKETSYLATRTNMPVP